MIKRQKVASSLVSTQSQLSVVGTFQVIQDAITELTQKLGIDGASMKAKYNSFWVFIRTRVKFLLPLVWNERMTINTFISDVSIAKMGVCVEIKNSANQLAIFAKTELCALGCDTEKIKKLSLVGVTADMVSKRQAQSIEFSKLNFSNLPKIEDVVVRYTNIDFCHHTNNLEYIRLIMNTYSVKQVESRPLREVEVNYISQSYENDTLSICKSSEDGADHFVLEKDGAPVVKCEIIF